MSDPEPELTHNEKYKELSSALMNAIGISKPEGSKVQSASVPDFPIVDLPHQTLQKICWRQPSRSSWAQTQSAQWLFTEDLQKSPQNN